MKIIGTTERGWNQEFIVIISENDLKKLIGYYYNEKNMPPLKVGVVLKIGEMFNQLHTLAYRKDDLEAVSKQLKSLADLLLLFDPIIKQATEEKNEEQEVL